MLLSRAPLSIRVRFEMRFACYFCIRCKRRNLSSADELCSDYLCICAAEEGNPPAKGGALKESRGLFGSLFRKSKKKTEQVSRDFQLAVGTFVSL